MVAPCRAYPLLVPRHSATSAHPQGNGGVSMAELVAGDAEFDVAALERAPRWRRLVHVAEGKRLFTNERTAVDDQGRNEGITPGHEQSPGVMGGTAGSLPATSPYCLSQ